MLSIDRQINDLMLSIDRQITGGQLAPGGLGDDGRDSLLVLTVALLVSIPSWIPSAR